MKRAARSITGAEPFNKRPTRPLSLSLLGYWRYKRADILPYFPVLLSSVPFYVPNALPFSSDASNSPDLRGRLICSYQQRRRQFRSERATLRARRHSGLRDSSAALNLVVADPTRNRGITQSRDRRRERGVSFSFRE